MEDNFEKRKAESELLLKERERLESELKKIEDEIKASEAKIRNLEKQSVSIKRDKLVSAKEHIANLSPERRRAMRKVTYKMLRKVSEDRTKLQDAVDSVIELESSLVDTIVKEELGWTIGRTRIILPDNFSEVYLVYGIRGSTNSLPEGEELLWELDIVPIRGNKPFYEEIEKVVVPHSLAKTIKVIDYGIW